MTRSQPNLTMDDLPTQEFRREGVTPNTAHEILAADLGYASVRKMMEQTEAVPLPSGGYSYLTTDHDGYWVAWKCWPAYDIQRFDSRQSALLALREYAEDVLYQS